MSTYAIGDVQGCYQELRELLAKLQFNADRDRLWFVGDMVNRGPDSAKVIRFIRGLQEQAVCVLGNHDLHLLALADGVGKPRRQDTFFDILDGHDREELLDWLARQPLLHHDPAVGYTMVHAGLSPQWDLPTAIACAREAEYFLRKPSAGGFYHEMYGDEPNLWSSDLKGWDRIRYIVNCFTRLRFCDGSGRLVLHEKGDPKKKSNLCAWFRVKGRLSREIPIVFGHWSTLGYYRGENAICLDSGCLWGGRMTAVSLDEPDRPAVMLECLQKIPIGS